MPEFVRLAVHKSSPADHRRAKELRRNPTVAEEILWRELRLATHDKKLKFRRQHPIHPFVADFVCLKFHLIIEVDGISHETKLDKDKLRDERLNELGYEVMRFTHDDVVTNCDGVVWSILNRARELGAEIDAPLP